MVYANVMMAQKLDELSSSLLKGHYIFNSDSFYNNRFGKPEKISHNIAYKLAEDRELVEQYLQIRQTIYRDAYNDENAGEDYTDRVSKIFVATGGAGNVVGGIRLTVSKPGLPNMMPLEHAGVNLRELFPEIDFDKVVYGEATRLAVLPDFRDGVVSDMLQMKSKEYFVKEMEAQIGFGCSTLANTKRFKRFFSRMGYSFIMRSDVPVKIIGSDAQLYLWAIDFTADKRFAPLLAGQENEQENLENSRAVAELPLEFA